MPHVIPNPAYNDRVARLRTVDLVNTVKKHHLITSAKNGLFRKLHPREYFGIGSHESGIFLKPTNKSIIGGPTAISVSANEDDGSGGDGLGETNVGANRDDPLTNPLLAQAQFEESMKYLRLMPKVITRLAERYRKSNGRAGILAEYHQTVPMMRAFAGYAAVKMGDIGIAKYKEELMDLFMTDKFDTRQEVKFGRRAGKTYMACLIIATLLITQPTCSGIFVALSGQLAKANCANVHTIIELILNDPSPLGFNAKIESFSLSDQTLSVRSAAGTLNKLKCTPNPDQSTLRGLGDSGGFFFIDESDFLLKQKFWDEVGPIWTMKIIVCMYSSQGFSVSPAAKMVERAILANGKRVWRRYRIRPGKVGLIVSSDYAEQEEATERDFILFGKRPAGSGNPKDPIQSYLRPWYDPVSQTLSERTYQVQNKLTDEEMLTLTNRARQYHKRDKRILSASEMVLEDWRASAASTNNSHVRESDDANAPFYYNPRNYRVGLITKEQEMELEAEHGKMVQLVESSTREDKNVTLNTDECVWLLTLPNHQDVNAMLMLKAGQDETAFRREMLSYLPDVLEGSRPAFDAEKVQELFDIKNRFDPADAVPTPLRWVISLDPGQGASSDSAILSALVYPPTPSYQESEQARIYSMGGAPTGNNPAAAESGFFSIAGNSSMKQTIVLTGMEILTKMEALLMDYTATRMLAHIKALLDRHPEHKNIPILIVPENNTRHAAAGLYEAMQRANLVQQYLPGRIGQIQFFTKQRAEEQMDPAALGSLINSVALGGGTSGGNAHAGVTSVILPGVTTDNNNKTLGVSRIASRLARGKSAIALSPDFLTTTVDPNAPDHPVHPEIMAARLQRELTAFQAIAPVLGTSTKVVTYSGKPMNEKDDCVMALVVMEIGNAEHEMQQLARRAKRQ